MSKSVRIVIPYFGRWPAWFPVYLQSCRWNPCLEIVLITDCAEPTNVPENVRMVRSSLEEMNGRIKERLGLSLRLMHPYKLCDFKPAYGLLFEDMLDGADYWGFGDIDVFYGRLDDYLDPVKKGIVDIFCIRKEYVSGAFTLIRNTQEGRTLFQRSPDWKRAFLAENYVCFDECGFAWDALREGKSIWEAKTDIVSFTQVVFESLREGQVDGHFESAELCILPGRVKVSARGIVADRTRYLLLHLNHCKNRWCFAVPKWRIVPEEFIVSNFGLFMSQHESILSQIIYRNWPETMRRVVRRIAVTPFKSRHRRTR